ncbi:MAG: hypothetical protein F7B59_00310, partial [Desulfurococcales archaeon]|nr:hypothetical protein [Desulfurococcales archaeon]
MNIVGSLFGLFSTAMSFDAEAGAEHEGRMDGCCGGWGWMGIGVVFWILMIIAVVAVVVYIVDRISSTHRPGERLEDEIYRLR